MKGCEFTELGLVTSGPFWVLMVPETLVLNWEGALAGNHLRLKFHFPVGIWAPGRIFIGLSKRFLPTWEGFPI